MAKKVLVVDSFYSAWILQLAHDLAGKIVVIPAASMQEAQMQLSGNDDVVAIAATPRVGVEAINLFELAQRARDTFDGPMILVTNDPNEVRKFTDAGGQHCCERLDLPGTILRVLSV